MTQTLRVQLRTGEAVVPCDFVPATDFILFIFFNLFCSSTVLIWLPFIPEAARTLCAAFYSFLPSWATLQWEFLVRSWKRAHQFCVEKKNPSE